VTIDPSALVSIQRIGFPSYPLSAKVRSTGL
jgi:hypothetical protein